jgi:exodeoxyribonuclease VII small subunit
MALKEPRRESFEQLYGQLEASVDKLERGGLALDDAITLYEEGMTLARKCQERLDEAELKITKLREAFAPVPAATPTSTIGEAPDDYEYVDDDAAPAEANDMPFE